MWEDIVQSFRQRSSHLAEVAKKLTMEKTLNEEIIILVDSQAAILAIQNNTVKSSTPGHTGIHGNEKADTLAKSGSAFNCFGPEPFVPIPYASCHAAIKDWSVERWKTSWIERKDCLSTKENVEWASPQLTRRLLSLNRSRLNEVFKSSLVTATYRNTGRPLDVTSHRHVQNVTWKKKLQITILEHVLIT